MKKATTILDTVEVYDFYRPHKRSDTWFTNETTNAITGEVTQLPSMTKQSFVDQCDINNILKQFKLTGQITHIKANAQQGAYLDLPDDLDFQSSMHIVQQAEAAFSTLPSKLRTRFENDPAQFLAFMADPRNAEEAVALGLATKRATDAPNEPQAPTPSPNKPGVPDGSKNAPAA
ncbi:MAG: internal scaffolding protein [Microviridae sp.]|nr:MAG: internal scaffolding protein [Microviridae sp.]